MCAKKVIIISFLLLLFVSLISKPVSAKTIPLTWSTTPSVSINYAIPVVVARTISKRVPEFAITVVESGGTPDNIERIKRGEAQLINMNVDSLLEAYNGIDRYEGKKPFKELRVLWLWIEQPYNFIVRRDTNAKKIQDLNGLKFNAGGRGTSSEKMTLRIFEVLNVKPDLDRSDMAEAIESMSNRRIDGFMKCALNPDANILQIVSSIPINILGLTGEEIKKILARYPNLRKMTVPEGVYKGVSGYQAVGIILGVGTTKDAIDTDTAYKIVKSMWEGIGELITAYPFIKGINIPELTLKNSGMPIHPGAIKYYKELGFDIPEEVIPPEMQMK